MLPSEHIKKTPSSHISPVVMHHMWSNPDISTFLHRCRDANKRIDYWRTNARLLYILLQTTNNRSLNIYTKKYSFKMYRYSLSFNCPHTMRDYCCLITMKGTNYKTNVSVNVRSLICDCISHLCLCLCDWHSTGSLIQVPMSEKGKITRGRLGSLSLKKEGERQCFLFSKHLIICTRGSGGKLHITKVWQDCNQEDQLIMVNLIITN